MMRRFKNHTGTCFLDNFTEIHDRHTVADIAHDLEVVTDENHGDAVPVLQIAQQIDDLRLNGNIKRRNRLIAHQQSRACGQSTCDDDALTLATRQFMRIAVALIASQPYRYHQLINTIFQLRTFGHAMYL